MTDHIVVLMTCKNSREAGRIAKRLVEKRLIACANIVPQIRSVYRWEGKIASDKECWVILKSTRALMNDLRLEVEKHHSYTLPELIALPIIDGSPNYLSWVAGELAGGKKK